MRASLDVQTGQSHQGFKLGVIFPQFDKQAMWGTINSFVNHIIRKRAKQAEKQMIFDITR